ncbi:MAG: hypothetical protein IJD33_06460 [Clostridia bacterium]|nr:hypothetical protein [Clostridia bacterium]
MAQKEYVSPMIAVNALYDEDIITASFTTTATIDGKQSTVTVGGFKQGWLG